MSAQPSIPGLAPAFDFLRKAHPEGVAPNELLLWTVKNGVKRSRYFRDIESAAEFAATTDADAVYFGVGLSPKDFGPHARCKADQIAALPGLVCDFDVYCPGVHEKEGLPPTLEEALRILPERFPPTITWSTGHGIQAIWLFKERWDLPSRDERDRAAALSQRWHTFLAGEAERIGYTIDAVHDLSRVLRLPGSTNRKAPADPRPVEVIRDSGRRYDPSDLENVLDTFGEPEIEVKETDERGRVEFGDLRVDPRVELAPEVETKLKALLTNDLEFTRVWNREKRMPKDNSWSGYAQSLANTMALAEFTDQAIIDILSKHRREHGDPGKQAAKPLVWFTKYTIPSARRWASEQQERDREREKKRAKRQEAEQQDARERAGVEQILSGDADNARQMLQEALELPFDRLVQVGNDMEPSYKVILKDKGGEWVIEIPSLSAVNSFVAFDRFAWRYTGKPLPSKAKKKWREVRTAMGKLIVIEDTGLGEIEVLRNDMGEYFAGAHGFEKYPAAEHPDGPPSNDRGACPFHGLIRAEDESEFHVALRLLARPQKKFGAACGVYYLNSGEQSDTGGEVATVVFKLPPLFNWLRKYKDRKFEAAELAKRLSGAGFAFRQTTLIEAVRLKRVWRGTLADGAVDEHGFGDPEARWLEATRHQPIQ